MISALALGTIGTRVLPFLLFPPHKNTPNYIVYLGRMLPYAVMGFLVIFCLKAVSPLSWPYGLPEAIAILCILILHLWRRNVLLSIGAGTAIYMMLVQYIFV
jgi:branched-subunit amino acid transport protein AzlD